MTPLILEAAVVVVVAGVAAHMWLANIPRSTRSNWDGRFINSAAMASGGS